MISLHPFPSLFSACCLILSAVRRFYYKFTNMSLRHIVLHEASTRYPQSHSCLNGLFFTQSLLLLCHFYLFLSRLSELVWKLTGEISLQLALECSPSLFGPPNSNESNAKNKTVLPKSKLKGNNISLICNSETFQ